MIPSRTPRPVARSVGWSRIAGIPLLSRAAESNLCIPEWGASDVDAEPESLGLSGSPTKVKTIENIVFQAKEAKHLTGSDTDIEGLIKELIASHTIG